jgi:hypothetical protein
MRANNIHSMAAISKLNYTLFHLKTGKKLPDFNLL